MTGVEEVVLDICVLTRDQMRTGGWQQLGQARFGPNLEVDELDPVTEGRDQDTVTQHPVLHRQLLEHQRGPRLLTERVHEQDDSKLIQSIRMVNESKQESTPRLELKLSLLFHFKVLEMN